MTAYPMQQLSTEAIIMRHENDNSVWWYFQEN